MTNFTPTQSIQVSDFVLGMTYATRTELFSEVAVSAVKSEIKKGFMSNLVNGNVDSLDSYFEMIQGC